MIKRASFFVKRASLFVKPALIFMGVILAFSLVGTAVGQFSPLEKNRQVTMANYSHRGEFSYTAYSTSGLYSGQSTQPPVVLFTKIIENLEILFAYSVPEAGPVNIKVTLEDTIAGWQKEIPVQVSVGPVISFPLNLDDILGIGNTINGQLGARSTSYRLRIVADVETGGDPFTATLEGTLDASTLKWDEAGFNKIERGFPGESDWRQAAFGYRVNLKENDLEGAVSLERMPDLTKPFAVGLDLPLVTDFVETVDVNFSYQFSSDARINSLSEDVKVEMVVEEAGKWKKSYTLVPLTKEQDKININIPLDISKLMEMAANIDKWVPGKGVAEKLITISAEVHTIAQTDSGTIDEIFTQQLTGKIGGLIEWQAGDKAGTNILVLTKTGKITTTITESNLFMKTLSIQRLRTYSLIALVASLLIFCGLAVLYWRRMPKLSFLEQELKRNKKKYGELISEVSAFPAIREGEVTICASSLEALVNISNNSLKAILLKVEPDKHIYCVIDGLVRYEYVSKLELPDKEERPEDEAGRRTVDDQR